MTNTFNLSLPQALVEALDKRAKQDFSSRSYYVRKAIVNQMRTEETLENLLNRTNKKCAKLCIKSEQQIYDIISDK